MLQVLGFLDADTLAWLKEHDRMPQTAGIVLKDNLIVGAKAVRHEAADNTLTTEEWNALASLFDSAEQVLWDKRNGTLIIVMPSLTDPRKIKLAVALDFVIKTKVGKQLVNSARTVFKVDATMLEDVNSYEVVR